MENKMVADDYYEDYIENDATEDDIFALIKEDCEEFDNWEEEKC